MRLNFAISATPPRFIAPFATLVLSRSLLSGVWLSRFLFVFCGGIASETSVLCWKTSTAVVFLALILVYGIRLQTPHQPIPQHGVLPVVAFRIPVVDVVVSHLWHTQKAGRQWNKRLKLSPRAGGACRSWYCNSRRDACSPIEHR